MHSWTLLAATTLMLGCACALAFMVWLFNRQVVGLPAWTAAFTCGFLASLNYLFRPYLTPLFAHVSIAILSVATAYFNLHACRRHLGLAMWDWRKGVLALLAFGGLIWWLDRLQVHMFLRFSLFSLTAGGLFMYCGWILTRFERGSHPSRRLFGAICGIHGFFLLMRPAGLWFGPAPNGDFSGLLDRAQPMIIESLIAMQLLFFSVLMLVNEHLNAELKRMAQLDPLTDVYNRRAFMELLDKAVSLAQRRQSMVPLLVIDLDHFKAINDNHGHHQGDQALCHFVSVVQSIIRREDVLGRLGGEEFAIFLPDTPFAAACDMAERVRTVLAQSTLSSTDGHPITLTASIGLTVCQNRDDIATAMRRADQAMYRAKNLGRNTVVKAV